ncbi:MAG: hypothetical protein REH83_02535, partial [Rickettsiella sp.]|nr:hypothetical protein [Rickettsiella sp.]
QFINVNQNRISILYDFSLVMLLPFEERLDANKLLIKLKKLMPLPNGYSISDYNTFISDLLDQSPLNPDPAGKFSNRISFA